ncbi:MAG: hypothetical protein H6833_07780 [Planctomycetes bacterium]|nr:hypothetical protein [Planctomycetota bacterium]
MNTLMKYGGVLAIAASALVGSHARAQSKTTFAKPELLMSGDALVGESRLYPSPVLFDVDGDGTRELVIGDLPGVLTASEKTSTGWGKEVRMKTADGKDLKFHNW